MPRCWLPLLTGIVICLGGALPGARGEESPQWRGRDRSGVSQESGLLAKWPEGGPKVRWKKTDLGTGYSTPSVAGGRVYVQTTRDNVEFAVALDEKTGDQAWSVEIGKVGENKGPQYPGTRSTPTVDGDHLYVLASDGQLSCLQAKDGKSVWTRNLATEFEGKPGLWAYTESVLVDGDAVVCTPGGEKASLAALNKKTGATLWQAVVPEGGTAEYASIMVLGKGDNRQYVTSVRRGLVGVRARDGKFLWVYEKTIDPGANIITPVIGGDRIFSAGGRTMGGTVQVAAEGHGAAARELYLDKKLAVGLGGAVLLDGKLFGTTGQAMFCADFESGKVLWTERALGAASICAAGGKLYVRGHKGAEVALVEPSAEGYREISRVTQPDASGKDAWTYPVVANGGLFLRDQNTLVCFEVRGN